MREFLILMSKSLENCLGLYIPLYKILSREIMTNCTEFIKILLVKLHCIVYYYSTIETTKLMNVKR